MWKKLNNNTKAQKGGCSTGAVDGVVKQKKSKGNVSAPSLGEVYKMIAKQTGKPIDEIKRIKNDPDGYGKIWREFQTEKKPSYWVVWPYSASKGWCPRITGTL